METIEIKGLIFKPVLDMYPEQYVVCDNENNKIAEVKMNFGFLVARYKNGDIVYDEPVRAEEYFGSFDSNKERIYYLTKCAEAINKY